MTTTRLCVTVMALTLMFASVAGSQSNTHGKSNHVVSDSWEDSAPTFLDQEKLKVEKQKADIEQQKANIEQQKANIEEWDKKRSFWISVAQVFGATVAIGIPVWLAFLQSRSEKLRRRDDEKFQFQLKAAEIAMSAADSSLVAGRAAALKELFPDLLPTDFAANLDPRKIRFGPGREMRLEFLKQLAAQADRGKFLVDVWGIMWPGDDPKWNIEEHKDYAWWVELKKYLATKEG